jgi:predicted membrane protein
LGGLDHDRYLLLIVPLLLVAVFRAYPRAWRTEWLIALTIGQLVCARAVVPMAGDASTHFALMVQSAPIAQLLDTSAVIGSVVVLAALLLRLNLRSMATLTSSRSGRRDVAA